MVVTDFDRPCADPAKPFSLACAKATSPCLPLPAAPWDEEIDEYDNHDDVGYVRKEVAAQQQFEELELDLQGDGNASEGHFFTHQPGSNSGYGYDSDSTSGSSDAGTSVDLSPHTSMPGCAPSGSQQGGRAYDAWDLGIMDIKLVDPVVTTPNKSTASVDQSKPVLSRVESLSSSFKDFDTERTDDEQFSGRVSGVLSDADMGNAEVPEVIDFPPVPLAEVTPQDLEAFSLRPGPRMSTGAASSTAGAPEPLPVDEGFTLAPLLAPAPALAERSPEGLPELSLAPGKKMER